MEAGLRGLRGVQKHVQSRLSVVDAQLKKFEKLGEMPSVKSVDGLEKLEEGKTDSLMAPLLATAERPPTEGERAEMAAWMVEASVSGRMLDKFPEFLLQAREHHLRVLRADFWHVRAVTCLMLLTFLEVPAWCRGGGTGTWVWTKGAERCTVEEGTVMLSGLAYLPPGMALIAELFFELMVLRKFLLEYFLERWHFAPMGMQLNATKLTKFGMFFAVGGLLDTAVYVAIQPSFRLNFVFRTGLIALLPNIRNMYHSLFNLQIMEEVFSVAIFFLGTVLFMAFICMTLWEHDTVIAFKEGEEVVRASEGFATFGESTYSMFVAAATGEFMETLLPSFVANHSAAIFWMFYLVLTKVLLKNMVMDTLISQYLKGAEAAVRDSTQRNATAMMRAYELLAGEAEQVSKERFTSFCRALKRNPKWSTAPEMAWGVLYDSAGGITCENFVDVCMVLHGRFRLTRPLARFGRLQGPCAKRWRHWILEPEDQPSFDNFMNMVLLLNLLLMVWESTYDVMRWPQAFWMNHLELSFALAYFGEFLAKLSVKTFPEYWSSTGDQFDFFTTWVLLFTSVLPYLPNVSTSPNLAHYANILRLLRLLKILKGLKNQPTIQFMLKTVTRIVTAGRDILCLMGLFFYFFCALSVNLFGGLLYKGNEKLEGTEYAENHQYPLNFNDMFMATAAYFVQVLCEYVPNYAEALYRASSWGSVAWWIFPLFYAIASSIMYELLLAFTVSVYMSCKEETYREEEEALKDAELMEDEDGEEESQAEDGQEGTGQQDKEGMEAKEKGAEAEEQEEFEPRHFFTGLQDQLLKDDRAEHHGLGVPMEFREAVCKAYGKALTKVRQKGMPHEEKSDGERDRICWASWVMEAGLAGHPPGRHPEEVVTARAARLQAVVATGQYGRLMLILVALTLLETPPWCSGPSSSAAWQLWAWSWMPGDQRCPSPAGGDVLLSGIYYLPPGISLTVEVCLLITIGRTFLLELRLAHNRTRAIYGIFLVLGALVDAAVTTLTGARMRLTFIFRTGLLYFQPDVHALIIRVFNRKMLGEFVFVAQVFIIVVLLFAWISYTLLRDLETVAFTKGEHEKVLLNEGFETLQNSIYTMFVAGISESFVEIFMPSMVVWPTYGVLWFFFLMLTQVLLLNLVIDAFVAAFLEASEKLLDHAAENQAKAILTVFNILVPPEQAITDETALPRQVLLDFTEELSRSPNFSHLDRRTLQAMLDHFGDVHRANFCNLCMLLQCQVHVTYRDSRLKRLAPQLWEGRCFKKLRRAAWEPAESPLLSQIFDWVLLANTVLVVAQFQVVSPGPRWMELTSRAFTISYVFEVFLKLSVISFEEYWSAGTNRFDFWTTWLLFGTMLLSMLPFATVHSKLSCYANLLRLLRLLRVVRELRRFRSFQFMVTTLFRMFKAAQTILCATGVVIFFFATLSCNCFGGIIYEGNPKLEESALAEKHWFIFNFNDPLMASFTWFTQLLNEYSMELAEALWLTSPYGEVAWWIVPAYYLLAVAIMFEILAAFTIETFLALKEENEREAGKEAEDSDEEEDGPKPQQGVLVEIMQGLLEENQRLRVHDTFEEAFQRQLKATYAERCAD